MGRLPRILGEDLWYHVYNRGNEKRDIFIDDSDRTRFLDLIFSKAMELSVEIHSYTLMPNHFHLLALTREPNLSRYMQECESGYVRCFNKIHNRVGHLYGSRFGAIVVESGRYLKELSRYAHLNHPRYCGKAGGSLRQMLRDLREYEWSSYRTYVGLAECPWPLVTEAILADFGETLAEQQRAYARYVEEGLIVNANPFEHVAAKCILGSEEFVEVMRRRLIASPPTDRSANTELRKITAHSLDEVIAVVCTMLKVGSEDIVRARVHGQHARDARCVLLWAAATWCKGRVTLSEIGRHLGNVTQSAVRRARDKVNGELGDPGALAELARAVRDTLEPPSVSG